MAYIYETENFMVESHEKPEIDRLEGGHVKISPKIAVEDRTKLPPRQAVELMRLTIATGEAMVLAMKEIGVEIGRINYQDNGNWVPELHIHLYCRAKDAKMQKYGDPIIPGHKDDYKALTQDDIKRIQKTLERLFQEEKFSDNKWKIQE